MPLELCLSGRSLRQQPSLPRAPAPWTKHSLVKSREQHNAGFVQRSGKVSGGRVHRQNQFRSSDEIQKLNQIAGNKSPGAGKSGTLEEFLHFIQPGALIFRADQQDSFGQALGLQRAKNLLPKWKRIDLRSAGDWSTNPAILMLLEGGVKDRQNLARFNRTI